MGDKRIPISEENRDALKERKRGDDTYDDVIERMLSDDSSGALEQTVTFNTPEIRDILRDELDAMSVDVTVDLGGADFPTGGDVSEEDVRIWIRDEIEQNVIEQAREAL